MNVTFSCPQCERNSRNEWDVAATSLECPHCKHPIHEVAGALNNGILTRCLVCPSTELFVRKDFPQRLGLALVGVGIVGSSIAWGYTLVYWTFGILFATALADVVLYMLVGDTVTCYRCHAEYRSLEQPEQHDVFDLEIHERYRQQAARASSQHR